MAENILQWNINGFRPQKENLLILINKYNPAIICLQETNNPERVTPQLKNYSAYFKNRTNAGISSGGVAVYVKSPLQAVEIHLITNIESVAVKINFGRKYLTICCIYLPNSYVFTEKEISEIIEQLPKPFIIVGDFNSHSLMWGSYKDDNRGEIIKKILEDPNIVILNKNQPTHLNNTHKRFSAIDLTLCSSSIAHKWDWSTAEVLYGSDHFPIILTHHNIIPMSACTTHLPRWKFHEAKFDTYKQILSTKINEINSLEESSDISATEKIQKLTDLILQTANETIPKTSGKPIRKQLPWWNEECKRAHKLYRHAFSKYKRHPSTENHIEYKRTRAKARRIYKESKRQSWIDFISSINSASNPTDNWKKIKAINGCHKPFIKPMFMLHNRRITSSNEEIANILALTFANNSNDSNFNDEFLTYKANSNITMDRIIQQNTLSNPLLNYPIQVQEVETVLAHTRNSSPGADGLCNIFLKELPRNAIEYVTHLFNKIVVAGEFPDEWREAIVIPILKSNKDPSNPNNYRPISLTSNLCKLLERIISRRLKWYLEYYNKISPFQSGFRSNRSTTDHLLNIHSDVCEAFITDQHLVTVSLDIEKAYDMVWRDRITQILYEKGVNGHILNFITQFMKNRSLRVKYNNTLSNKYTINNGVPQGSVLSVLLFLIAIDNITDCIHRPLNIYLFADDITITVSGKNIKTSQDLLQFTLNGLQDWSNKTGFKISKTKSECIVFSKRDNLTNQLNLTLGSQQLKCTNVIKILGMIFDNKLTWRPHIENLKSECFRRMNIIKAISSASWGADSNVILSTYKAIIRSKLDYGAVIYQTAKATLLNSLNSIHSAGLRLGIGAYRTSPISSILVETNEEPLHIRRRKLCFSYASRISATPNNPAYKNVFSRKYFDKYTHKKYAPKPFYYLLNQFLEEIRFSFPIVRNIMYNNRPPWLPSLLNINIRLNNLPKKETNDFMYQAHFNEICNECLGYTHIFTDGSRTQDGAGCAVKIKETILQTKLRDYCSIFYCEAYAILLALKYIQEQTVEKFVIFTDSQSVLTSLRNTENQDPIVQEIVNLYYELLNINKIIILIWVPSHRGIAGNMSVDQAAKDSVNTPFMDHPVSHRDIQKELHRRNKMRWNTEWMKSPHQLHQIRESIFDDHPPNLHNRKEQITLARLRIGHSKLTHQHLLTKETQKMCDLCKCILSVPHILLICPIYDNSRSKYALPPTLSEILNSKYHVKNVLKFLSEINITNKL